MLPGPSVHLPVDVWSTSHSIRVSVKALEFTLQNSANVIDPAAGNAAFSGCKGYRLKLPLNYTTPGHDLLELRVMDLWYFCPQKSY